jgi:hypothetical protein
VSRNDGQCHDDRPKGSPTGGGGGDGVRESRIGIRETEEVDRCWTLRGLAAWRLRTPHVMSSGGFELA